MKYSDSRLEFFDTAKNYRNYQFHLLKNFIKKICILFFFYFLIFFNLSAQSDDKLWYHSSGNYKSHKFSNLKQINLKNISELDVAWIYRNGYIPNINERNNNQLTPIFTGSSIITTSLNGFLISLDPENGKEKWRIKLQSPVARRGLTYYKNLVFVPTSNGVVVINEKDGKIFKKIGNNGFYGNSLSLLAPIINGENILIAFNKKIESFSLKTGKSNWTLDLNGARVWSGFSFDNKTKTLFVVTSNLISIFGNTDINPDYSNSILLIDSKSGKVKCSFKDVAHDHWDLDMVGNPIVTTINTKGIKKNVVYSFSKTGNIIVIDINKCELAFENSYELIKTKKSDIKNQTYSTSQKKFIKPPQLVDLKYDLEKYISHLNNNDEINYIKFKARNAKYNEEYIPISLNYDVIMFGLHGGPEWSGGSLDKNNNQIILPTNHYPWIIRGYYYDRLYNKIDSIFNNLNKKILKIKKIFFNKPDSEIVEKKYLSPWEKFNGHYDSISATDKIYSLMSGFINRKGKNIYKSKCQSCHGSSRQGFYESESSGDKYYPSLIGVSFTKKSLSLKNMKTFENSHRYNENKINITEDELSTLKTFFNEYDNILKKFNLLREYGRWQLFLDKNKLPASSPPWGKITAINIDSGEINWSIPFGYRKIDQKNKVEGDMNFGGILTTAGDIFFATGTPDEFIRGYNSINGNELWKYKLPVAGSASPMTYFYKDYQYIIVNVTGGRFHGFPNKLGDYVFAFRINKNKI